MEIAQDVPVDGAWHAVYTRHQHEKTVACNLTSKGFDVFLPLYPARRRWKDRVKQLSLPLFPCYVFLRGGLERRVEILTTPGIHFFVSVGGRSAIIPQPEIEAIRRVIERGVRIEPYPYLKCGDRVRIKSGPLEGIEGILLRKKNLARLVLSVELLEKSAAVEIDFAMVERVATGNSNPSWRLCPVSSSTRL